MLLTPGEPVESIGEVEWCYWFDISDEGDVYCVNPVRFTAVIASRVEERITALVEILRALNLEATSVKVYVSNPEAQEIYSRVFTRVKPIGASDDNKAELVIIDCSGAHCETETIFSIIVRETPTPVIIATDAILEPRELPAEKLAKDAYRTLGEKIELHPFFIPILRISREA